MENVVLIIHLLLALSLIGAVLLQRSEGGGLGIGGGGGTSGGRPPANAISKFTWILAVAFICTSITLTLIAANQSGGTSVADRLGIEVNEDDGGTTSLGDSLLPPTLDDGPLVPTDD